MESQEIDVQGFGPLSKEAEAARDDRPRNRSRSTAPKYLFLRADGVVDKSTSAYCEIPAMFRP
jgi:hypothetical protein